MQINEIKKHNKGGARPGAGRKRRMEEHELIQRLYPMAEDAFKVLHELILQKDTKALQIFCSYFIGMPTQKVESRIEGRVSSINVEIIKPTFVDAEIVNN